MYFIESVIKYSLVDEVQFMYDYYLQFKNTFLFEALGYRAQLEECASLINAFNLGIYSPGLLLRMKQIATIARELRLGQLNKKFLQQEVIHEI